MAIQNNARCAICDNEYYVCHSCKEFIRLEPWKIHTDTSECYKIFQIIRGYSTGVYDKAEAKEKLQNVDLTNLDKFKDNIKTIIKDIIAESKATTENSVDNETVFLNKRTRKKSK